MGFSIIRACRDQNLFRPYLADATDSLHSWRRWLVALRVIYGLPLKHEWQRKLVRQCTGRNPRKLPKGGFRTVLLLCGRRSGKSKIAGLIAAYEASLSGRERVCSPGEMPMVSVVSPTRDQSRIIKSYARAALRSELLNAEIADDTRDQFRLENGVTVRLLTGTFRHVRSYSQICVVADELAFFNSSEESKCSDTELIRGVKPGLLTTKGRLICLSTKYKPSGWCYSTWKRHFGNDKSNILVWDAPSTRMNLTLSQEDIQAEIDEDPIAARAEFLNEWREDIEDYLPRSVVEQCVVAGRKQLLPQSGVPYFAFADCSGGRQDPAALAIGHRDGRKTILDCLKQWTPPFSPVEIARQMAQVLQSYRLTIVVGDRYAAQYTVDAFKANGIRYIASEKNKSECYLELIGPICSQEIELLDDDRLVGQLSSLERRPRSSGGDKIDHPSGGHDDLSNVVAGVSTIAGKPKRRVGTWGDSGGGRSNPRERLLRELISKNATVSMLES